MSAPTFLRPPPRAVDARLAAARRERAWLALALLGMVLFVTSGALHALHTLNAAWYLALASCAVSVFFLAVRGLVATTSASVGAGGVEALHKVDAKPLPFV